MENVAQDIVIGNILRHPKVQQYKWWAVEVVLLILLYIYSGYRAQRQQRHLTELQTELQDAHFSLLTQQTQLTLLTRQSMVAKRLKEQGSEIEENRVPVIRLK